MSSFCEYNTRSLKKSDEKCHEKSFHVTKFKASNFYSTQKKKFNTKKQKNCGLGKMGSNINLYYEDSFQKK